LLDDGAENENGILEKLRQILKLGGGKREEK